MRALFVFALIVQQMVTAISIVECDEPTFECLETNVGRYLAAFLDTSANVSWANTLNWTRNGVRYADGHSLRAKSLRFLMTHDVAVAVPEGTLRLAPRAAAGGGALVRVDFEPSAAGSVEEGRLFFKKIKNFKKFISQRLIWALLAILLVIKLLAAKLLFFLPSVIGAVAAKKLLLKGLLFVFPALHHVFKFCPYVPHATKFHHHKHHIAHVHHVPHAHPPPPPPHHHHKAGPPHLSSIEVFAPHAGGPPSLGEKPSLHHYGDFARHEQKPAYDSYGKEFDDFHGAGVLTHDFINHRQDDADNELKSTWGQGQETKPKPISMRPFTVPEIETMIIKAEKEHLLKLKLQKERFKIQEENAKLQEQLKAAMRIQDKLKQQAVKVQATNIQITNSPAAVQAPYQYQKPPSTTPVPLKQPNFAAKFVAVQQQEEVQKKAPVKLMHTFEDALHQAATITYDSFYSPILEKIDHTLNGLGFNEEACRERLICSMYKNPVKFSPHSNLLSAELSRDSKELQKPKTTNAAVIRFYRYVQAARDGQDKRECLRLYPTCSINTELK